MEHVYLDDALFIYNDYIKENLIYL